MLATVKDEAFGPVAGGRPFGPILDRGERQSRVGFKGLRGMGGAAGERPFRYGLPQRGSPESKLLWRPPIVSRLKRWGLRLTVPLRAA